MTKETMRIFFPLKVISYLKNYSLKTEQDLKRSSTAPGHDGLVMGGI